MSQLTNLDVSPNTGPTTALYVASRDYPQDDAYLQRIWRHAFLLALVGYDHCQYQTSNSNSTLWKQGDMYARVYEGGFIRVDTDANSYRIDVQMIDGKEYSEWIAEFL